MHGCALQKPIVRFNLNDNNELNEKQIILINGIDTRDISELERSQLCRLQAAAWDQSDQFIKSAAAEYELKETCSTCSIETTS